MRFSLLPLTALTLVSVTACSGAKEESSEASIQQETAVQREAANAVPDIAPSAAPGVAFAYNYAFVLPDKSIAGVQEAHASACEKLGPGQCRIAGMRYTLLDDDRVSAELRFKLAPDLARAFGKDGIAAVEKAAGKLINAEITGDDVSGTITSANVQSDDAAARLAKIEARLNTRGLGDAERSQLQAEAASLRNQIAEAKASRIGAEAQLASTPMTFTYEGKQGFSLGGNPIGDAVQSAWGSFANMVSFVLLAIGILLPWAGLGILILLLWRSRAGQALRRFLASGASTGPADKAET